MAMRDQGPPVAARLPLIALLGANTISLDGNQLTFIAIPWFILQMMGSPAKAGFAAACAALTSALAALFGGPLVHHTRGLAFWQILLLIVLGALLDAPAPGGGSRGSTRPPRPSGGWAACSARRARGCAEQAWH